MKWINENEGNILVTLLAVILGVFLGIMVHGMNHNAEAVLGGSGTLTNTTNPHNLAANSAGIHAVGETQICIFCHTPHGAIQNNALINGPLWNHKLSEATYTVKTAGIFNASDLYGSTTVGLVNLLSSVPDRPDGASRLCLSCHDGTVAVGETVSRGKIPMVADACLTAGGNLNSGCPAYLGTDLTTKHVVSVPMNSMLIAASAANCISGIQTTKVRYPFDTGALNPQPTTVYLRPTAYLYSGMPGVRVESADAPDPATTDYKYSAGYSYGVQCSTCHDPHYWVDTADPQITGYKFLVIGFDDLCNACHNPC